MPQLPLPKISRKFLLIFSVCSVAIAGIVYACGDGGWDDQDYSSFAPQAFVSEDYSPFFYTSWTTLYINGSSSNSRYNESIVTEWQQWFKNKIDSATLNALLLRSSELRVDSAALYVKGKIKILPEGLPQLKQFKSDKKKAGLFFNYLQIAKAAESYAVGPGEFSWYAPEKQDRQISAELEQRLLTAMKKEKDPFIRERLWFQTVRYYYFLCRLDSERYKNDKYDLPAYFASTEAEFPKNTLYYRSLGYLAGYYYLRADYSQANYLYSKGYDYALNFKIPSQWSFRPQEEKDWEATLALAKTTDEKITLWHLLGTTKDELRAIGEIYKLNPASEKLDLLLSRLINKRELNGSGLRDQSEGGQAIHAEAVREIKMVNGIAAGGRVHQPILWKMGAGYLNALVGRYTDARKFYDEAEKMLPSDNQLLQAQYRLLDWTLYLNTLKKIDAEAEGKMVGPLNWLAELSQEKAVISDLRYSRALGESLTILANLYTRQGELVKANCFRPTPQFYKSNTQINALKALLAKTNQSAFEKAMLRFYPVKLEQLNYLQASQLVYQDQPEKALVLMQQAGADASLAFQGNPFNMRLVDCHDCDHAQELKTPFTNLSFVETLVKIKAQLTQGKDVSRNASLLANAYYNISYYGNGRSFYQSDITGSLGNLPSDLSAPFRDVFTSNKLAEKYYLLARKSAASKDLQTKYTFLASKCERNTAYNAVYFAPENKDTYYGYNDLLKIPAGQYYAQLKKDFANTAFYNDIINECSYFRTYLSKNNY